MNLYMVIIKSPPLTTLTLLVPFQTGLRNYKIRIRVNVFVFKENSVSTVTTFNFICYKQV